MLKYSRFSVVVAVDGDNGIGKNGKIPWKSDLSFFRELTSERTFDEGPRNVVIMGRKTFESIGHALSNRITFVISNSMAPSISSTDLEGEPNMRVCASFEDALEKAEVHKKKYGDNRKVFIAGGERVYRDCLKYIGLCDNIYVTKYLPKCECDKFFPYDEFCGTKRMIISENISISDDVSRIKWSAIQSGKHQEIEYLKLLADIRKTGIKKDNRTGISTVSSFGRGMRFDLRHSLPVITTKKVNIESVIKELLFFISGKTDTKILEEQGVGIWKGNTSREFLDSRGLNDLKEGDYGKAYGYQWRNWGGDQLSGLVKEIKTNPDSRRLILSSWNVGELDQMALPPCHLLAQFNVRDFEGVKFLDCQVYQRSMDLFLGAPYNITSYSCLVYIVALLCDLTPGDLIFSIGDAHIYLNHFTAVDVQLERNPFPFPLLVFSERVKELKKLGKLTIDDFVLSDFRIINYEHHPFIKGEMAV